MRAVFPLKKKKILKIFFTNKKQGKEEKFEYFRFLVTLYLVYSHLRYLPIIFLQLLQDLLYLHTLGKSIYSKKIKISKISFTNKKQTKEER
jgi:hypothetical protein